MSCKKDGQLFPEFNDENLSIQFTDTFNIITTVIKEDSIQTDISGVNLLGIYHDSIMGFASSSIYTEITLAGTNVSFGNNAVIDSAVLSLKYLDITSFYGNILTPMSINVFQLTEQLTKSEYYSNEDLTTNPSPLGSLTFTPVTNDSTKIISNGDTIKLAPQVRIRLDDAFGQSIIDLGKNSNTISDNQTLKNLVNGFHITPNTTVTSSTLVKGDGAIITFDMNSSASTLTLYYHNDTESNKSYSFLINSESKKFNRFNHNYSNTDVEKHLAGSGFDSTITYVQSMGGVKTKLLIPNIKELTKEGNVIINKAELVLTINDGSDFSLKAIENLVLTGINSSGTPTFLIDYFEGSDYFGGTVDNTTKTYRFNISRHLQDIIQNNTADYGLYLMSSGSAVNANRSIINSFKHPSNKIKLNITYSKY
jgi:hypothetical protein